MFNTLESYHFVKLPKSIQDKADKMIDDISPLGMLNEGTIDAAEVWGLDDILLLMRATYNEAKKDLALTAGDIDTLNKLDRELMMENPNLQYEKKNKYFKILAKRFNEQRNK